MLLLLRLFVVELGSCNARYAATNHTIQLVFGASHCFHEQISETFLQTHTTILRIRLRKEIQSLHSNKNGTATAHDRKVYCLEVMLGRTTHIVVPPFYCANTPNAARFYG